jgi:hypothetical protein
LGASEHSDPDAAARELGALIRLEIASLTAALSELFQTLPPELRRPSTLAKSLRIDTPLASRLLRLAHATDAEEAVELLPTMNQLRRAVSQAGEAAPGPAADAAISTIDRFQELISEMGGDQRGFESLVSVLSPSGIPRVESQRRREAFRANAHLWGMSVDTIWFLVFINPSAVQRTYNTAIVHGYLGARTIRPSMEFRLRTRVSNVPVSPDAPPQPTAHAASSMSVLPEFSSVAGQSIEHDSPDATGFEQTRILLRGRKPSDAATFFVRILRSGVSLDPEDWDWDNTFLTKWPAANLVVDFVAPVGTTDPASLTAAAFARNDNIDRAFDLRPEDRVPLHEKPRYLGALRRPPPVACVPRLGEVFADSARQLGVEGGMFDMYRLHVEHPMLHALVQMHVRLRR